ncbi:MAG: hypothetical protein GY950_28420, partial [bacterium]|nr:hypothetical protein [bacterium]
YPLVAGIAVFLAGRKIETVMRPVVLLLIGIIPILFSIFHKNDFVAGSISRYNDEGTLVFLMILALIGVFVGSRIVSVTDHAAGRLMGGISGIIFMALVLLPIGKSGIPLYFGLFKLLKGPGGVSLPGSVIVMGVILIAIFTAFLFASLIAIINFPASANSQGTAVNSYRLVLYGAWALPVSIMLLVMFSGDGGTGMKGSVFTLLAKLILMVGGFIALLAHGLWDLTDLSLPKPVRGSDLLKPPQQAHAAQAPRQIQTPPNIYGSPQGEQGDAVEEVPNIYQGEFPPPPTPPEDEPSSQ